MATHPPPLRIETLRELIAAGSVRSATLLGQRGGFFGVNVVNFEPGRLRPARPNRAVAMKSRMADEAYTEFLRERTQAALDDPRPAVPAAEAAARMDAHKAALAAKLATALGSPQ